MRNAEANTAAESGLHLIAVTTAAELRTGCRLLPRARKALPFVPPRCSPACLRAARTGRRNRWAVGAGGLRRGVACAMEPGSLASGARRAERRQRAVSGGHGSAAARSASPRRQQQPPLKQRGRFQREGLAAQRWPERTTGGMVRATPSRGRPRMAGGQGWVVPAGMPVAGSHGWLEATVRAEGSRSRHGPEKTAAKRKNLPRRRKTSPTR